MIFKVYFWCIWVHKPAVGFMCIRYYIFWWHLFFTDNHAVFASCSKWTANWWAEEVRRCTFDRCELLIFAAGKSCDRVEQTICIWVLCIVENFAYITAFDDFTAAALPAIRKYGSCSKFQKPP